jgi:hypothetical protein
MNWENKQAGRHDHRKDHDFGFDDAPDAGAGQFDLPEIDGGFTVVVDGDGGIPDFNALVAEKLGPGNKAGLPDQRQADELAGNAFHAGGDIGNDGV